jgi:hypothetical protein
MSEKKPVPTRAEVLRLARAIISLADTAGMPDSYRQTDSRMKLAAAALRKYVR